MGSWLFCLFVLFSLSVLFACLPDEETNAWRQSRGLPPTAAATCCHAAVQNVKAEAVLFLSMPQIHMPASSILMQVVCGPVCGLAVQDSPVLSSFLRLEGRCGYITTQLLGLLLPTKVGCSYPQRLCQCPVRHLTFVLVQYRLVGFIGECSRLLFQACCMSNFFFLLYALFQKLHVSSSL